MKRSSGLEGMRLSTVAMVAAVLVVASAPGRASAAPWHPSHADKAPRAPTGLTVAGRVAPLAVEGVPRFGWLPQDSDGDEVQSAYQIVVTSGRDGAAVWDSGRVPSSQQSWVGYGGPPLTAGTTYRWTVRTWDRYGAVSPAARPASFDTGLGDGDWSGAQWIRRPATANDAADEWTLARTVMRISAGSRVVRARAYVAATGDWALYVDGVLVHRSASYGYPGEGYYDVADLAARAGKRLAIGLRHHYWACRCQGRANGPLPPEGPSGLLVKIVVDHADGTRDVVVSDPTWRVTRDTSEDITTLTYRNSDAGDRVERYDATQEIPGWDTAGYDDSAWAPATLIGAHPRPAPATCTGYVGNSSPCVFTHLSAQQAHISQRTVHPVSVRRLPDGTIFADFGKVFSAVPRVSFRSGAAGRAVTMTTSYRRANTTLATASHAGATSVSIVNAVQVRAGDEIVVDAPADGYGAGSPESRTVVSVEPPAGPAAVVSLDAPLRLAHASGAWVEHSRAGTSRLDTQGSDMRYLYTQKPGAQVAQPFTYWGWRYLEISDPGERLSSHQIAAVVQATDAPADHAATFRSGNPTLDAVFQLMQHSALQTAQNVFLDTPTREKGQFLGDAIDISFATMESLDERSLTRQAIEDFIFSQARFWPNGGLNAVYPNGDAKRDIPDYTEMFPEWVLRYYQLTGDRALLARALPTMKRVADYISAAVDQTGLVYQLPGGSGPYANGIVDWPAVMRYDTVVGGNGARTVVNALAVGAFRSVAAASAVLDDPAAAQDYAQRAGALTAAMNSQLREPGSNLYSDGLSVGDRTPIANSSQHSQSFPVAYGVAPSTSYAALGDYVSGLGMRQGPMTLRQLLAALRITGRTDSIVRLLTDTDQDGPAKILAEGGTFMWEQWSPGCGVVGCRGSQVNQNNDESMSHGWGAAGIVEILQALLGVTVTGAGASTIQVAPPATGLAHAHGTEWTERGRVSVAWTRDARGYALDVEVPVNVTATVVLPAAIAGSGYRATGDGGARLVSSDGTRTVFTAGSGHTHVQPVAARGPSR
ncbi:MAG: alpha-L-rhamnosidase [Micromonosporaceae bacterium]